jgi:hypothetical protein
VPTVKPHQIAPSLPCKQDSGRMCGMTAARQKRSQDYPLPSELLYIFQLENHAVRALTGQLRYVRCGCLALG